MTGDHLPPASNVLCAGETDADGVFVARDVRLGRFRLVIEHRDRPRQELELGSIEFSEPAEYAAVATVHAWTPAETHIGFQVPRGPALTP